MKKKKLKEILKEIATNKFLKIIKKIINSRKPKIFNKRNLKLYYAKKLETEIKALKIIDYIMVLFVSTNIIQMAYVFGKGMPGLASYIKSAGFAFAEVFLARAIGRAIEAKRKPIFLWVSLSLVLLLTVGFNLLYDLHLLEPYKQFTVELISFDPVVWFLALGGSGMVGLIILGLSYVRVIQSEIINQTIKEQNNFTTVNTKKEKARLRGIRYRQRQKEAQKKAGL